MAVRDRDHSEPEFRPLISSTQRVKSHSKAGHPYPPMLNNAYKTSKPKTTRVSKRKDLMRIINEVSGVKHFNVDTPKDHRLHRHNLSVREKKPTPENSDYILYMPESYENRYAPSAEYDDEVRYTQHGVDHNQIVFETDGERRMRVKYLTLEMSFPLSDTCIFGGVGRFYAKDGMIGWKEERDQDKLDRLDEEMPDFYYECNLMQRDGYPVPIGSRYLLPTGRHSRRNSLGFDAGSSTDISTPSTSSVSLAGSSMSGYASSAFPMGWTRSSSGSDITMSFPPSFQRRSSIGGGHRGHRSSSVSRPHGRRSHYRDSSVDRARAGPHYRSSSVARDSSVAPGRRYR